MKFEYKNLKVARGIIFKSKNDTTIDVAKPEEFEQALNELGAEGWELAQILHPLGLDIGYVIFKRQVG